jgi:Mg2+ and Co2+ transporter CorA
MLDAMIAAAGGTDLGITLTQAMGMLLSAVATFLATWLSLVRPLKASLAGTPSTDQHRKVESKVARHEERIAAMTQALAELRESLKRLEERCNRAVTDDEFAVYMRGTTDAINTLTEKVGRAAGILEAMQGR